MNNKNGKERCCVPKCKNKYDREKEIQVFEVPKNKERAQAWYEITGMKKHNSKAKKYVCQDHFHSYFLNSRKGKYVLRKNAIPTQNLHLKSEIAQDKKIISKTPDTNTILLNVTIDGDCCREHRKREIKLERIYNFKRNLKHMKPGTKFNKHSDEEVRQLLTLSDKYLPRNIYGLIQLQFDLKETYLKTKLTLEYKEFALHLYYCSPLAYEHLRNILQLPTIKSLKSAFYPQSLAINEELFSNLEVKINMMTDEQKHCVVCVDVIDLKPNLYYIINRDEIVGIHNVNGVQTMVAAQKAIVVMIQGVLKDWVQPIGMALLADTLRDCSLKSWIENIISNLFNINLNVLALVSDINMAHKYNLITDTANSYFNISDKRVYHIFDVPCLLTDLRNSFVANNFYMANNSTAKWSHVVRCCIYDKKRKYSLLPKLDEGCLKNKLHKDEFKYAVKLFRTSTAAAISNLVDNDLLANDALGTCEFIHKISNIFDLLTSYTENSENPFRKSLKLDQSQLGFLLEMMTLFQNLKIISEQDTNLTNTPLFIKGFITTIESLIIVKSQLDPIYEHLLTRRFSLNCVRNFYSKAKENVKGDKMTAKQVMFNFKECFTSEILKSPVEGTEQDNLNDILSQVHEIKDIQKYEPAHAQDSEQSNFQDACKENGITRDVYKTFRNKLITARITDYECRGIAEFILRQADKVHECDSVRRRNISRDFCKKKYTDEKRKAEILAIKQFDTYISKLNEEFTSYFYKPEVSHGFLKGLLRRIDLNPLCPTLMDKFNQNICSCFPLFYAKLLFCRLRLREELKYVNKKLKTENQIPDPYCCRSYIID